MHLMLDLRIPSPAVSCSRKQLYNSLSGCVFLSSSLEVSILKLRLLLLQIARFPQEETLM